MLNSKLLSFFACGIVLLAGISCSSPSKRAHFQHGESLVLVGEEKGSLAFAPVSGKPVALRSTYLELPKTIHYEAGRDYLIDSQGQIQRTPQSRIPDFRTNILYGQNNFSHDKFPGFGNGAFFVYVDYYSTETIKWPVNPAETGIDCLKETQRKLRAGEPLRVVVFGDSISTGCDATERRLFFWQRWADGLSGKYPKAKIEMINGATGGDTTREGLKRLEDKVLSQKPDLVLIGFGMNDHNFEGFGVRLPAFADNLRTIIDRIREKTGAEMVLYSTFPPNPKWAFGTHNMEAYAQATGQVAREKHCAFADIYHPWQSIATRKKPEDLLANNINHPNDYGHWIYLQALTAVGL